MDDLDKKILARVQLDFPVEKRPFSVLAGELGLESGVIVERLKALKLKGIIREIKAILRHRSAGYSAGAMVAWAVDEDKVEAIGAEMAHSKAVSHCYERPGFGEYRLFTMIHGRTDEEVDQIIQNISETIHISHYKIYRSIQELKKSSMEYFQEDIS